MNIDKFRLNWKGGNQEQMNVFEHIADTLDKTLVVLQSFQSILVSIDNGVKQTNIKLDAANVKLDNQLVLSQDIANNTANQLLLSQQIADNTSCACNALQDVNEKLDEIIDKMGETTPPVPVYDFELVTTSYQITDADISRGYFDLIGISTKDGALFDSILIQNVSPVINEVHVVNADTIAVFLKSGTLASFTETIELKQSGSNIIQSFELSYSAPVTIPDEFRMMSSPSHLDYLDTRTEITIDVVSYYQGSMFLPVIDVNWRISSYTSVPFGTEGKSMFRLKVQTKEVASFNELAAIPFLIKLSSPVGSADVPFQVNDLGISVFFSATNYTNPEGEKGIDPYTYEGSTAFPVSVIQNLKSLKTGGVQGIDYASYGSRSVTVKVSSGYPDDMALVPRYGNSLLYDGPEDDNAGYFSLNGGARMVIGKSFNGLILPIEVNINAGLPLMGGAVTSAQFIEKIIPFAPCPYLGSSLPMQWMVGTFPTFEYPVLPPNYGKPVFVEDVKPESPVLPVSQFRAKIGYPTDDVLLGVNGYGLAMKNSAAVVGGYYSWYTFMNNLFACYAAVVINKP